MNAASPRRIIAVAMSMLDSVQTRYRPEEQAMGAAAVFLHLAEHYKVPAQDMFVATKNLINGSGRKEFDAINFYLRDQFPLN